MRLPRELGAIARHPYRARAAQAGLRQEAPAFLKILRLLRAATGVDFSQYKPNTLLRRMERRIILQKAGDPDQYLQILQQNPAEVRALAEDLLINVTEFFRDPPVFEALKENVVAAILREKQPGEAIRVWVPGCSTGEEVYSIAMCLTESIRDAGADFPLQLFGTDVSEKCIEKARAAIYSQSAVSVLSPERLKRFFVEVDSGYQIVRSLRDQCVFAVQNIAADPPFSRMDLISCRNLLIYLGPDLQQRVMDTLFYALQPNGFLLLGKAERPGSLAEYFLPADSQANIYVRKPVTIRPGFELPAHVAAFPVFKQDEHTSARGPKMPEGGPLSPVQKQVDRLLLAQYAPPSVVIDGSFRIVEFRGDVGAYLAPACRRSGSGSVPHAARRRRFAPAGARLKRRGRRTWASAWSVFRSPAPVRSSSRWPLRRSRRRDWAAISSSLSRNPPRQGQPSASPDAAAPQTQDDPHARVAQLDAELASTRRYLQSIIEELRSANEEAQSSNEELQSSNEELQTAKEELQASNEELHTLNAEMDSRNAELKQLTDDLLNLLTSLHTPILMLDSALRIRRFTQASEKLLNLIPTDIGRPVSDLKPRINIPRLEEVVRQVVDTLSPHEREAQDQDGRWFSLRVRPYRTSDNRIDGAVLQLLDIDELKRSMEQVRLARDYASAIVQTVREPLVVLDSQLRIETANRAFYQTFHTSPEESLKRPIYEVGGAQFDFPKLHDLLDRVATSDSAIEDVEIERDFERIGRRTLVLNARRIEEDGRSGLILLAFQDITERKRAAEARYRRLFEAAKDGILIADAHTGEITDINPFLENLTGYRREEVVGRKVWEIEPLQEIPDAEVGGATDSRAGEGPLP